MLTMLEKGRARARMPRTLILEPTRELAAQVKENFDKYGVGQKLNVALLIGGVSFGDQDTKLTRGVDVLIATPGRLLDHTERGRLLLTGVELLVIDEADRMLDMGFIPDIERICKLVPFTRQTLFFTATMPPEISRITEAFLHNPAKDRSLQARHDRRQRVPVPGRVGREPHEKREILRQLLRDAKDLQNAIIFCNRKREVAVVYKSLQKHGFSVGALHGDMDQSARTAALDQFRKGEIPLLVASDVAARGLDIPESATSSISTCRIMPTIMSIASAAPAAPAAPAPRSRSSRPLDRIDCGDREADRPDHSRAEGDYAVSVGRLRRNRPAPRATLARGFPGRFTRRSQAAARARAACCQSDRERRTRAAPRQGSASGEREPRRPSASRSAGRSNQAARFTPPAPARLRAYPRSAAPNRAAPSATPNRSPPITRIFRLSCCGRLAPASDRPHHASCGRNCLPARSLSSISLRR